MTGAINTQNILKMKADAICDVPHLSKTEEQLREYCEKYSTGWKKEFGDFGFKVI